MSVCCVGRNAILLRERDPQDQRVFLVRLLPGGDAFGGVKAERNRMLAAIGTILTERAGYHDPCDRKTGRRPGGAFR